MPRISKLLLLSLITITVAIIISGTGQARRHESSRNCRHVIRKSRRLIRAIIRHKKRAASRKSKDRRYHNRAIRFIRLLLMRIKKNYRNCFRCLKSCRDVKYKYALLKRLITWEKREETRLSKFVASYMKGRSDAGQSRCKSLLRAQYQHLLRRAAHYKARLARCKSDCFTSKHG